MGQKVIIGGTVSNHYVGTTNISNPILFLEVDGVPTASSYVIQTVGDSVRFIFPKVIGNDVYLVSMGQTYGEALPEITVNVRIMVAE